MRGRSPLQAVHRARERVRECATEREGPWNAGESGQLVARFCFVIDVTYYECCRRVRHAGESDARWTKVV